MKVYPFDDYDNHGFIKPPSLVWISWFFLIKVWVIFLFSVVTREESSRVLAFFYTTTPQLYVLLSVTIPIVFLMWMIGIRRNERPIIARICSQGRIITLAVTAVELYYTGVSIYASHGVFKWGNAISVVGSMWIIIYFLNSQHAKDSFSARTLEIELNKT